MKIRTGLVLLVFGLILCSANQVIALRGSGNRVATVSLGKRFDRAEVIAAVEPVLGPLGYTRVADYVASVPGVTYETGGGIRTGGAMALISADRSLQCVSISVTDFTRLPEERIIPTINAIATALANRYGTAMKYYSDGQCLHEIHPRS